MESLHCIIHYNIMDAKYSKIKPVLEIRKQRIINAKNLQESKGGLNYHKEECNSIPEMIAQSKHGVHLIRNLCSFFHNKKHLQRKKNNLLVLVSQSVGHLIKPLCEISVQKNASFSKIQS